MHVPRARVVHLVQKTAGDDEAAAAHKRLPDPVDLRRDAELLASIGISPGELGGADERPVGSARRMTGRATPGANPGVRDPSEPMRLQDGPNGSGTVEPGLGMDGDSLDARPQTDRGTAG